MTITREFTKEQLIEQARKNIEILRGAVERIPGASDAAVIHLKLARIALASLEAEIHSYTFEDEPRPLYTAPPRPAPPRQRRQRCLMKSRGTTHPLIVKTLTGRRAGTPAAPPCFRVRNYELRSR